MWKVETTNATSTGTGTAAATLEAETESAVTQGTTMTSAAIA